jgi:hypothetical protein
MTKCRGKEKKMPSKVTFASACPKELRADATLPLLLDKMLAKWQLKKRFGDTTWATPPSIRCLSGAS